MNKPVSAEAPIEIKIANSQVVCIRPGADGDPVHSQATYPVEFDRPDVELAEPIPRVPRAGDLYCVVDDRPANCQFKAFELCPEKARLWGNRGVRWILRVRSKTNPLPKVFIPDVLERLFDALRNNDTTLALQIMDSYVPGPEETQG